MTLSGREATDQLVLYRREETNEKLKKYYYEHGTTLCGLVYHGRRIDYDHWHAKVHTEVLPYDEKLHRNENLISALKKFPQKKVLFSNADIKHCKIVLDKLGIADLFDDVLVFERLMPSMEPGNFPSANLRLHLDYILE